MAIKKKKSRLPAAKRSPKKSKPVAKSRPKLPVKLAAKPAPKKSRYVYYFGAGQADGDGKMKPLLGGKGANLAEMTRIGLPVPPGFTITTEVCTHFYENGRKYPAELTAQVENELAKIEKSVG